MWHYLGLYVARPLLKTNITPNQITVFWILLEVVAALFMLGNYWLRITGIFIFNVLVNLLDYTDGNVARLKNIKTHAGIYLDYIGIFLGMPLMLLFLGLGIYLRDENLSGLYLGGLCCIFLLYEKLFVTNASWFGSEKWPQLKEVYRASSLSKKNLFSYLSELFRRTQPLNLLFFGIVLDYLIYTLVIYTIISFLAMVKKLVSQYRAISKLDREYYENNKMPNIQKRDED